MANKKKKKTDGEIVAEHIGRAVAEAHRRNPKLVTAVAIILLIVLVAGFIYWYFFMESPENSPVGDTPYETDFGGTIQTDELTIRFLELGNGNAGDSVLIKVNNTEVLIDSGSTGESPLTTVPEIRKYCTDGVLEYVIVTHGDTDHIAGFYGNKGVPGIFESFECQTIIDFPLTSKNVSSSTTNISKYFSARDAEVEAGAVHYTALQCWNETDGAKREYILSENVKMSILYNYYYENTSSDENNYSVCMLLTQGDYHYLFTGDLEKKGEEYLVQYNNLPECVLFKGGHHGSPTSSNDCLLSVIKPKIVCVCCCAGSPEYTPTNENMFPSQAFINRVGLYTQYVYVTTLATNVVPSPKSWNFTSLNGVITFTSDGKSVSVSGSNNSLILKETDWFKANRTWPTGN